MWYGRTGQPLFLSENILSHADSFSVLVVKFGVGDKAVFLIKSKYAFIMLYICIDGKKAGSEKLAVADSGKGGGFADHIRTKSFIFILRGLGYREFCYFHGWQGFEWIVKIMQFLFCYRQFDGVRYERHIGLNGAGCSFPQQPCQGDMIVLKMEGIVKQVIVVFSYGAAKTI